MPHKPILKFQSARYVDIKKHWSKLKPFYFSREATRIWRGCLLEYALEKAVQHNYKVELERLSAFEFPERFDGCDWRCDRRGRHPEFWRFVCHSACHWLVDLNLFVAMSWRQAPWRIVTKAMHGHSTVWNGDYQNPLLFDGNFLALEVSPEEALRLAWAGRKLKPLKYLKGYLHNGGAQ